MVTGCLKPIITRRRFGLGAPMPMVKLQISILGLDGDKGCNGDDTTEQLEWEGERAIVARSPV